MTAKRINRSEGEGHVVSSPLFCSATSNNVNDYRRSSSAYIARHASRKRSRRSSMLFAITIVLLGICMISYPFASDYLNKLEQAKVTQSLEQTIEETPKEDLSAYMQQAQDYNARLLSGSSYVIDPFDPEAPTDEGEEYLSCLNLNGDGVMGQIVIPSIGVNLPISHGTDGSGMDHGVGHVTNTSLPVGGVSTHAVLAGHTGLPSAVIFDKLDELSDGDYFIIQVLSEDHAYRVISTEIVLPEDTSSLGVKEGQDLVTLVTCTPYGVNSHRLLIHAERCDIPQDWLDRKNSGNTGLPFPYEVGSGSFPPFLVGVFVAIAILGVFGVIRWAKRKRRSAFRGA